MIGAAINKIELLLIQIKFMNSQIIRKKVPSQNGNIPFWLMMLNNLMKISDLKMEPLFQEFFCGKMNSKQSHTSLKDLRGIITETSDSII